MIWEIPPTSGLGLRLSDLLAFDSKANLPQALSKILDLQRLGISCSGSAAFVAILALLKKRSARQTVIVPAFSCPLVVRAIRQAGLRFKLCDTQEDHFDFNYEILEKLCDKDTLCIVPTYLAGISYSLERVLDIAKAKGADVVEDAAQALGASFNAENAGSQGDFGFFSLAAGKGLTTFEGGLFTAKDPRDFEDLLKVYAEISPPNFLLELLRSIQLLGYAGLYNPVGLWFAYGISLRAGLRRKDFVKAVSDYFPEKIPLHILGKFRESAGANAAKRLAQHYAGNRARAKTRLAALEAVPFLKVIKPEKFEEGTWPYFFCLTDTADRASQILSKLWSRGLGVTKPFAFALSDYKYLDVESGEFEVSAARKLAGRVLSVTNSANLDQRAFEFILKSMA